MVGARPSGDHQRRSWRRAIDKPAVSAELILDDGLEGEVGLVSEDIYTVLFRGDDGNQVISALALIYAH